MEYDITIGLEIHVEPNTRSKVFCGCKNQFADAPNTNCCPVCIGLPGALPVVNRAAVEKIITAGLAFDCKINETAIFERKNYFYPDLSKAYQISQLAAPSCVGGHVTLKSGKVIRLNRIHLEEDAGKLVHDEVNGETLVDYNRGGVPLFELVTEPDFTSAAEVVEFLEEVRSRYIFAGVANCKLEEGGMRCDVNLSLKPKGSKTLGNRTEIKNLNSFKMVARAIEYEAARQAEVLRSGKKIVVETRKWNDASGKTTSMRSKEQAHDYKYFPDPDQYAIKVSSGDVERLRAALPTLAHQWREKFVTEYALPAYDADIITRELYICDFFNRSVELLPEPKKVSNWLMTNILAKAVGKIEITPKQFTDVIKMTDSRKITRQNALVLFDKLWSNEKADAEKTAKEMKIYGGVSRDDIIKIIDELFAANPAAIGDFASTPDKVINFFMGQTMKRTGGMADSVVTKEIILAKLK